MYELITNMVGKYCIISQGGMSSVEGTVRSVKDNWLEVERKDGSCTVRNLDYVSQIREYPVGKNGKRKSVVLD